MFLTVGIATVDLFASGLERLPQAGGDEFTVDNLAFLDDPLTTVMGGNASICAFALARLGASVAIASAVGRDPLGDMVARWLAEAGVETSGLKRSQRAATAATMVITDRALNRLAFHHPGASTDFELADLPAALLQRARVLLLSSYPLLPRWRPDGFAATLQRARQQRVITALDIGPAIGQPARFGELHSLLPDVDYFICNEHELAECTGVDDLTVGIERILAAGAGCAVIKRGAQGAVVHPRDEEMQAVPGFAVDARFTVGAGDSFNAGLLWAIDQGRDLTRAVRFANAVAALVVSGARGALGAPTLTQVEQLLAADHSTQGAT